MLKRKPGYTVAILGATGAVGQETLEILEERKFPLTSLRLFASKRSAGEIMACQGREWTVEELTESSSFDGVDLVFISATDAISKDYGQRLGAAGIAVIDDSAVFRMDDQVPLVVPEVNAAALRDMPRGIVAIPNCTTTPLVMALKPLHDAVGVKRVVVTTFQSVSGTGSAAMDELMDQTKDLLAFRDITTKVYPYQIAFNLLPHIGSFNEGGDCSEEAKIAKETRKILGAPQLRVTATTVRVRNGRPVITDGPFAETREQLGGYYLIEAADLDQALSIAGRIPSARSGCVEVRPIMETPSPDQL